MCTWHVELLRNVQHATHKMYQYYLRTAPWWLKLVAVCSVNEVMLNHVVHWSEFYVN
jgi:hypothetical protein